MNDTVACYIIDEGYLLPALVSAIGARKYASRDLMDVVIYVSGVQSENGQRAQAVANAYGVEVIYVPASFNEGKPPHYGRLLIHKVMDPRYKRIIYIDGDTQVAGSLDPLAVEDLKPGTFMAARDPSLIFAQLSPGWHKRIESHRARVGYDGRFDDYFNTGVLVINRDGWPEMAERAMELYDRLEGKLIHFDQDLMNLALGDRCVHISNRWNFPGFLIGSRLEAETQPVIYHFLSNPRPWNEAVLPWGYKAMKPYDDLLRKHPELSFLRARRSAFKRVRYTVQQMYKHVTEYGPVGRRSELAPDISV
jgi:lipopolysaccharide biosynthesis glycosyltransferase